MAATPKAYVPPSNRDPRIGAMVLDRYRVTRVLGEGGMGTVYLGEHTTIRRQVALKFLHPEFASDGQAVSRFRMEAQAASRIGNEHIVQCLDMGTYDDSPFMVLEYLDGRDLFNELGRGTMPIPTLVNVIAQVCEGLSAAHEAGIVHRDLKPENIFLCKRPDGPPFVKVLDFGVSKFIDGMQEGLTRTGVAIGTPQYMAPEQMMGAKEVDRRADVYSLGVILFQCLTGKFPFGDGAFTEVAARVMSEPVPSVRSLRPEVSRALDHVVQKAMAKSRGARFPDCITLRAALLDTLNAPSRAAQSPPTLGAVPAVKPQARPRTGTATQMRIAAFVAAQRQNNPVVLIAVGGALVLLGGLVLALVLRGLHRDLPAAPAPVYITQPAPTQPVGQPVAQPTLTQPAAARAVRLRIQTEPVDAKVQLDGHTLANPFDGTLPVSAETHRLEVSRDGNITAVNDVSLEFDQTIVVRLRPGTGVDDQRHVHHSGSGPHTQPANTVPTMQITPQLPAMHPISGTPSPVEDSDPTVIVPPPPQQIREPF